MSYSGLKVKIPLGEYGVLSDIAQDKMPPNALIDANNVCFAPGLIQKAPGSWPWNEGHALGSNIVGVHWWVPNSVTERMIAVTEGGSIYKGRDREFNNGTAINQSIASTLTPNCVFAEGGAESAGHDKKLFLFTGGATNPYVMQGDATAFAVISRPSSDWTAAETFPKFGVVHRQRLWAFARQFAYGSDTGDHENFQTADVVMPVYPGEGGELRGAFVFKSRLLAYKDGGFVYMLNDDAADSDDWYWSKIFSNFGLSAPNGIAEVLNNLYAGNTAGTITDYAATQALGGVEAVDLISELGLVNFFRDKVGKSGLDVQHMVYYPERKWLLMTYRNGYKTYNNALFVFDFSQKTVRAAPWIKGAPTCLGMFKDVNNITRPMYGDTDGIIKIMDWEDRTEAEYGGYVGEFQIPHLDFSHVDPSLASQEKHFDFLAVHYVPEGDFPLYCDYFIDGRYVDTIEFPMRQYLRPQLGTLILGTDRLSQSNHETGIRQLKGTGRTFSARFYSDDSDAQSFQVAAITVMFRPGGTGAQKV